MPASGHPGPEPAARGVLHGTVRDASGNVVKLSKVIVRTDDYRNSGYGFSNLAGTSGIQPQTVGTRLYLRQGSSASVFNVGVSKNSSNTADIAFDTTDFALNTPLFIVGSYKINGVQILPNTESKGI